jgi:hypothetical protein
VERQRALQQRMARAEQGFPRPVSEPSDQARVVEGRGEGGRVTVMRSVSGVMRDRAMERMRGADAIKESCRRLVIWQGRSLGLGFRFVLLEGDLGRG